MAWFGRAKSAEDQSYAFESGALSGLTIAFDLDGTLVDTAPDLVAALNATLAAEGLPEIPLRKIRMLVGHGARAMILRGAAESGVSFSDVKLDALTDRFIGYYRADIAAGSRPFPGARRVLSQLREAGARLSVCTNKRTDLAVALLDALDLGPFFAAVIGADRARERKPSPLHFVAAVEAAGGDPTQAIMIGDGEPDLLSARRAGAPAFLARFGYSEDVAALAADAIFDRYDQIPGLVAEAWLRLRRI